MTYRRNVYRLYYGHRVRETRKPETQIKKERKENRMKPERITTMKKNVGYEINPIKKTITLSKKFLKGASVMGTPEYKELKKIQNDNPGFELKVREINQKESKMTYSELTFAVMESIIKETFKDENEQTEKIAEFNGVKAFYDGNKTTKYGHVKSWFVQNYKKQYIDKYGNQNQKKVA